MSDSFATDADADADAVVPMTKSQLISLVLVQASSSTCGAVFACFCMFSVWPLCSFF